MDMISNLQNMNLSLFMTTAFLILSSVIFVYETIGKFSQIIGCPVKWVREKENDHKLLMNSIQDINELKKQHETSVQHLIHKDAAIAEDLKKLTELFVDKQIDDMRYEILDFASALSAGREFSKEQFDHILNTYQKYEKILEENNRSNGQVVVSMEVINDIYKEKLKEGFEKEKKGETS